MVLTQSLVDSIKVFDESGVREVAQDAFNKQNKYEFDTPNKKQVARYEQILLKCFNRLVELRGYKEGQKVIANTTKKPYTIVSITGHTILLNTGDFYDIYDNSICSKNGNTLYSDVILEEPTVAVSDTLTIDGTTFYIHPSVGCLWTGTVAFNTQAVAIANCIDAMMYYSRDESEETKLNLESCMNRIINKYPKVNLMTLTKFALLCSKNKEPKRD